ncbi:hypothetical protein Tco_1227085 [Tanacetum coccineum]
MKESEAYKTYYAFATGKAIPKPKYKKQPAKGLETLSEIALSEAEQMKLAIERSKTQLHSSQPSSSGAHEGTGKPSDEEDDEDEANIGKDKDDNDQDDDERTESDNDGDDFIHPKPSTHDDKARKDDEVNKEESNDESNEESNDESDEEVQGENTKEEEMDEETTHEEDEENELYRDVNVNLEGRDTVMMDAPLLNVQATQEIEDTHVILTAPVNPDGQQQSSFVSSGFVSNMLNPRPDTDIDSIFTLNTEATSLVEFWSPLLLSHLLSVSSIPGIADAYLANKMHEAVKTVVHLQSERLRDEAQAENEDFLNKLDDNIKKIIKDQVKEQVKAQVSKILPKIKNTVNEQLKVEVMTRSSTESKTSLTIAANLSELELKNILIDKIESNNTPKERIPKSTGKSTKGSKSLYKSAGESAHAEEPMHTAKKPTRLPSSDRDWNKTLPADHGPVQPWLSNLAWKEGPRESFDELMDTPLDFLAFMMNRIKVDTLTLELLAGPTFELMKGTCKIISFDHFINNELAYLSGGVSSRTYATSVTKTKAADYGHIKWIDDLVPNTMWSEVPIVEWHGYKHLDWITVRRDDEKLYTFKEGDFKRLRLQDIEDRLILLAQGKLTNLNVEDRLAFGVSLRMFTRSIVIQRRVEDLQLGVESYQKKLNIKKSNTYRSDLKHMDAYTTYSNPRGFIYQNKDKKNKLMRIDKLYKFSDGTLDDVWTALNDRLKGIRMEYLPQTIWRQSDRERAKAMIQAIDKQLKSRRIMRGLERFVGGRPYGGDFWLLQRTI